MRTQEQKELLLKDLSARLPYGVKCAYLNTKNELKVGELLTVWCKEKRVFIDKLSIDYDGCDCIGVIPYLFPLSSMTEKQKYNNPIGFSQMLTMLANRDWEYITIHHTELCKLTDWLNKNHFDYRGLIPMGLALDATNLNIY